MLPRMSPGRFVLTFVLLLALAGGAGALLVPLPRTVRCEYELLAAGKTPVAAPLDGVLLEVADAGTVEAGATLARYDVSALELRRAAVTAQRDLLMKKLESPMDPELLEAVRTAERRAQQARSDWKAAKKQFKPSMTAVLKQAERQLAEAKEAAKPVPSAQLEEPLAKLNAELAALDEQQAASLVSAPVAGEFQPAVKAGDTVRTKQDLGVLVDASTLVARVTLPGGEVAKRGRLMTLVLPLARKTWALDADSVSGVATVELDNRDGALAPGATGVAELEGEPRPFFPR